MMESVERLIRDFSTSHGDQVNRFIEVKVRLAELSYYITVIVFIIAAIFIGFVFIFLMGDVIRDYRNKVNKNREILQAEKIAKEREDIVIRYEKMRLKERELELELCKKKGELYVKNVEKNDNK